MAGFAHLSRGTYFSESRDHSSSRFQANSGVFHRGDIFAVDHSFLVLFEFEHFVEGVSGGVAVVDDSGEHD